MKIPLWPGGWKYLKIRTGSNVSPHIIFEFGRIDKSGKMSKPGKGWMRTWPNRKWNLLTFFVFRQYDNYSLMITNDYKYLSVFLRVKIRHWWES